MKELLLLPHLGIGDMLICNGMVRELAKKHRVTVLCKEANYNSAHYQWRELDPGVMVQPVADDGEAKEIAQRCKGKGIAMLALGLHNTPPTIAPPIQLGWDEQLYKDAGVAFSARWESFSVKRNPLDELQPPKQCAFVMVHEDKKRGFRIKPELLPKRWKRIHVEPKGSDPIFVWRAMLEKATEIHCIESSVAILADSLPDLKAKRLVIHAYARQSVPPRYKRNWEIIR